MSYGPVDVERWVAVKAEGEYLHVFLDGVEVTDRCFFANDETGVVHLYRVDDTGRRYVDPDTGDAACEVRQGRVEILPEPAFP